VADALLVLRDLSTGYGGVPVVRALDLSVHAGEVVALLGPNGAGKTSTLLAASGLLPILEGSLEMFGQRVPNHARAFRLARNGLAHVPEDRALFPGLTVAHHLRLARRSARSWTEDRVFGYFPALSPLRGRRAGLLSGGEQQMVALARALVSGPRLLLVDEMSLGLAPQVVSSLLVAIRRLADEEGIGVLVVEQHVQLGLSIADRAYVLRKGEVVVESDAVTLRDRRDLIESSYLGGVVSDGSPNGPVRGRGP